MATSAPAAAAGADPFDLARFVTAQDQAGTYETACRELAAGAKRSHWMWFVLPQLRGLGSSATAHRYGIGSLAEAKAYVDHPVLGPRLRRVADLLLAVEGRSASAIMGSPDDLKLRSSMTLFSRASDDDADRAPFQAVLDRYFAGALDPATLHLLGTA